MNKVALKKFAAEARIELLERVERQARKFGITAEKIQQAAVESSNNFFIKGKPLSSKEMKQRNKLISRIEEIGFDRVMEEVAYTWFNRFTALRFMEVNDYLPTKIRALSSTYVDSTEPEMIKDALTLDLDVDKEYIYDLKMNSETDTLFKYLIIKICNDLNKYMPFMFETIDDYSEILFPDGLLASGSFLQAMTDVEVIPEHNWGKIEVIGWLYQYYIADEKDRVFKAKKKYKADEIPFATQLFTPDWIVQYMVQNSLGRKWIEAHPEHTDLQDNWEFFLEDRDENSKEKLALFIHQDLKVEDIKCFDPAMGSGHILVYMFDVLYEIYSKSGYMERDIPKLIIENNLFGLDIDDRATQLASFSVVMKALQYNKRFLSSIERNGLTLNLAAIEESNEFTEVDIAYLAGAHEGQSFDDVNEFIQQYMHAKSIGSLIKVTHKVTTFLQERVEAIKVGAVTDLFEMVKRDKVLVLLPKLINQTKIMGQRYDILVTNPPYMGAKGMNKELSDFLRRNYPDSKSDLFAAFMELDHYLENNAFYASINQHAWMFLSSYEQLRKTLLNHKFIDTMLHLGPRAFEEIGGEVVQTTTFVMRNTKIAGAKGIYLRLIEEKNAQKKKAHALEAVKNSAVSYRYLFDQENVNKIPGSPIAYWLSDDLTAVFANNQLISDYGKPCKGIDTGKNDLFLRLWFEVDIQDIGIGFKTYEDAVQSNFTYYPYNKGGSFRKWYGNNDYILYWKEDGKAIKAFPNSNLRNKNFYRLDGLTWSTVSSSNFSIREFGYGFYFDNGGSCLFIDNKRFFMALLNSKVYLEIQKISPTLNFQPGDIGRVPVKIDELKSEHILQLVNENVGISKNDWDAFEASWDFKKHPLLTVHSDVPTIASSFNQWSYVAGKQFNQLKQNEEELNRLFIDMYDLKDELNPAVDDQDVSIRKADLARDIKSFISYAIGCSFGRYSLDEEGIVYAGGEFDPTRYETFSAEEDNILPILTGAYFEDDLVTRFVAFVQAAYGQATLGENLDFITDVIGRRKNETARETLRRYFMNDFYKDHVQTYKKRPIYWLFTSGPEKAFNCLIYMHRYDSTTLSRIRTDYLHEYQIRLDALRSDYVNIIEDNNGTKEITDAKKEIKLLDRKISELKKYDERLHHFADMQIDINLDDGVKVNYERFDGLVSKI